MRLRLACTLFTLIAACGGEEPSYEDDEPSPCLTDDELPVELEVAVQVLEPPGEPSPLTAAIEGLAPGERYFASFDSRTEARAAPLSIEVFHDGTSLTTWSVDLELGCDDSACSYGVADTFVDFCLTENGEVRWFSTSETAGDANCVADAFCEPRCYPSLDSCDAGTRCGSRLISAAPVLAALDCVPIGTGAAGAACSYGAPGPDGHDDCNAGLVCVDAICRPTCAEEQDCDVGTCAPIAGHAREIQACVPAV